jgi:hypothetical protein
MNTITERQKLMEDVMKRFEQAKLLNWPYLTGFYSSLLVSIAADRPKDVEYVIRVMEDALQQK